MPTYHCYRHNNDDNIERKTLFINNDNNDDYNKPKIINRFSDFNYNIRDKRDVNKNNNKFLTNITETTPSSSSAAATIGTKQTKEAAAADLSTTTTTTQNPVKLNKNSETSTNNLNNKIIPIVSKLSEL